MQVLRVLNLSGNRIEGVGRHYSDARKQIGLFRCESIDLSSNQLQDWPTFLSNLPKLHSLVLSANPLGTPSEGGLAKFTSLTELGLGAGLTSEAVLSCLRSCPALESLTLENNGIGRAEWMESPAKSATPCLLGGDDVDPAHRSTGAEAKDRDLTRSADRPEPVDPNIVLSWKAIGSMYWVKTLNLSRNQLNCVPKLFSRFTNLESLNLSNNVINRVPELELPALKKIDLSHNLISDVNFTLKKLDGIDKHFHGIQDLNISWNKLVSLPRFEMQDEGSCSQTFRFELALAQD
ncbi:hypothetical protein GUITHDRAFT_112976 [Guillardia theta CCMP2712]|uniref:Uncharacterized protein n=1 Tax=Guillardia theta (strain CCMP2712) TaxID=905079 RepID=L1IXZ7_GUITC|nr:hypothetical protein GUITHDRAFT_112976 [Guillardia theta CCMP2712]EKX40972.1 hypothetical protein GUITHDRAFT_112976 [Guillardia theta CCMP2712]|eukprot:XP_005827952.1 hypothetical protein GUITHDRAFT_112976 [Guillardia theta CCMP2712]